MRRRKRRSRRRRMEGMSNTREYKGAQTATDPRVPAKAGEGRRRRRRRSLTLFSDVV